MRKLLIATAAVLASSTAVHAETLKMATLPANLMPAIVMATFANIVSSNLDDIDIEVAAGGAATAHMMEVGRGNIEMSMSAPTVWFLMKNGQAMYANQEEAPALADNVQLVMWYPYGQYSFTVRADSDIQTLDDLEGASVFLGPTGGGAWNAAYAYVKGTTGLDAKEGDYEAIDANWVTGYQAFLDGAVDMYVGGCIHPCGAFLQITETEEIRFVGPADDTGEAVDKALGKYRYRDTIPTGLYSGQMNDTPVQTFNTAVGIVVNADVPEDTVYRITKAFWENVDSVTSTAPWAASLDPQFGGTLQGSGISLHPGAMKYYKEIGVQ